MYPNIQQTGYVQQHAPGSVIVQQPLTVREWTHDLCGCFNDCGECKIPFK
jgi:hypothetical protein